MRSSKQKLTVKGINKVRLKAGETQREIPDTTRGLRLVVSANRKALAWRGTINGKQVRTTLGEWPQDESKQLGVLAKARAMAEAYNSEVQQDRDPFSKEETHAEERAALTLGAVTEAYITFIESEAEVGERSKMQVKETAALLRRELATLWGRPYLEVGTKLLQPLLDALKDEGKPRAAGRLFESAKAMSNAVPHLARFEDHRDNMLRHPWVGMKARYMVPKKTSRDRVLTADEIRAVWTAAEAQGFPYGDLIRILILTGSRLKTVSKAPWSEFDLEAREWRIPASRDGTKSDRDFVVPLPDMAVSILESLPRFARKDGGDDDDHFVFTTTGGAKPVSGFSKSKKKFDEAVLAVLRESDPDAKMPPWVVHDLRRTLRTNLTDLCVAEDTAEMCLNHKLKGLVETYNRSDMKDRRRQALELWAARVQEIVGPTPDDTASGKVTRLDSRRKAVA